MKKMLSFLAIAVVLLCPTVRTGAELPPMPLATFETDEEWQFVGSYNLQYEYDPSYVLEGDRSLRVRMQPMQIEYAMLDVHYDMSADGEVVVNFYNGLDRYGSATYLTMWLFFQTSTGNYYSADWTWLETLPRDAWTVLRADKSEFSSAGSPNWANVNRIWIRIRNPHPGPINEGYVWIDSILFIQEDAGGDAISSPQTPMIYLPTICK